MENIRIVNQKRNIGYRKNRPFDTCEKTGETGRIVRQLEETREQDGAAEGRKMSRGARRTTLLFFLFA